jgi:hypothetical protein
MATERPYAELTEDELRAQVLQPDRRLPPPNEAKALLDEWVLRQARETPSVERACSPNESRLGRSVRSHDGQERVGPSEQATPAHSKT